MIRIGDMEANDEFHYIFNQVAQDIVGLTDDPFAWRAGVLSLIKILEGKTRDRQAFESMLANLCDDLAMRVDAARWP